MSMWFNQHIQTITLVLSRMRDNAVSTFMISLVIAVAMCLPSVFYIGVDHLSKLTEHMKNETEISLFLTIGATQETIAEIDAVLAKNIAIREYHLVTKEQAWQQLQEQSKDNQNISSAIEQLGKNPLPDAFFIQAKSADPEQLETLKNTLQSIPGVEHAVLNAEWAKRLATVLSIGKQIIWIISSLLGVVLLVIIGNTVRMQILSQKDEIEVSYLIGATNSFIRMPFLYAGILYGLLGGLLAILMIIGIIQVFNYSVMEISRLYSSDFSLSTFNLHLYVAIIALAIAVGWAGSYLAATRAIRAIKMT